MCMSEHSKGCTLLLKKYSHLYCFTSAHAEYMYVLRHLNDSIVFGELSHRIYSNVQNSWGFTYSHVKIINFV